MSTKYLSKLTPGLEAKKRVLIGKWLERYLTPGLQEITLRFQSLWIAVPSVTRVSEVLENTLCCTQLMKNPGFTVRFIHSDILWSAYRVFVTVILSFATVFIAAPYSPSRCGVNNVTFWSSVRNVCETVQTTKRGTARAILEYK